MTLPKEAYRSLVADVFLATHRGLARGGRAELGVDVSLDEPDDGVLLAALADFLWTHRHAGLARG